MMRSPFGERFVCYNVFMHTPTLYLFVGYPGAGKTTTAKIIAELTGAEHLWTDKERRNMFGAAYRPEHSDELYQHLNKHTEQTLKSGGSVVFDTNFNHYKDREHLRRIATSAGAKTVLIWIKTPQELAYHRAVTETNGKRLFVDMSHEDFERVASHLESPNDSERPIVLDGTKITPEYVKQQLGL